MDGVWETLGGADFWLGAVVASFVMGLLAAYVKPWLDGSFAALGRWQRDLLRQKRERDEAFYEQMMESPHMREAWHAWEIRLRFRAAYGLLGVIGCLVLSQSTAETGLARTALVGICSVSFVTWYASFELARKRGMEVDEALRRLHRRHREETTNNPPEGM